MGKKVQKKLNSKTNSLKAINISDFKLKQSNKKVFKNIYKTNPLKEFGKKYFKSFCQVKAFKQSLELEF